MSKIEVNQISSQCGSTLTIGQSGDTVTLAAGATQSGFGQTYTATEYCTTVKTAPFTAVSGKGYYVNTTCAAVTVTLPATPTAGDIVSITDYARKFGINNVTVARNGSNIQGKTSCGTISTSGQSTTFTYVDGTQGWLPITDSTTGAYGAGYITATGGTVVTCGDYKIHIFTADGTFCVSCAGNPAGANTVSYLVIAGGGAGGRGATDSGTAGAGGGAGGYRESKASTDSFTGSPLISCGGIPVTATAYPITVGAGGTTAPFPAPSSANTPSASGNGANSVFSTITSAGGGGGGNRNTCTTSQQGAPGGSGGGGAENRASGSGNTPPVSPPQGNPGGGGPGAPPGPAGGKGGGGAGAPGSQNTDASGDGGPGGAGINTGFLGSIPTAPTYGESGPNPGRYFAGGGGGGGAGVAGVCGSTGGIGGGGNGSKENSTVPFTGAQAGSANMGGGGGAGGGSDPGTTGANGGSGIVMIRYKYQ